MDATGGLKKVVLARPIRDGRTRPRHQPVPPTDRHVLLLWTEEGQSRAHGKDRHEEERIGPAPMIEAIDRGTVRESFAVFQANADVRAHDDPRQDPGQPRPNRPPDGMKPFRAVRPRDHARPSRWSTQGARLLGWLRHDD